MEGTYSTGYQEHIYIECQAMTGWLEEDGTVGGQGLHAVPVLRAQVLKHALELADDKVRVIGMPVGGGFGGKEDYPSVIALHTLLLSKACGHPVRIAYDRHEDIICTTKRHPSRIRHRTAVDAEGRLTAMDIEIVWMAVPTRLFRRWSCRGRFSTPLGPTAAPMSGSAGGCCENQHSHQRCLSGIWRTPGAIRHGATDGPPGPPTGNRPAGDPTAQRPWKSETPCPRARFWTTAPQPGSVWRRRPERRTSAARWKKLRGESQRGRRTEKRHGASGLSLYFHGAGFTGNGERTLESKVRARLLQDGRIEVLTAAVEMGQGCDVLFPMLACEATGLQVEDVVIAEPDTARRYPTRAPASLRAPP